jgi:hypothetical protein
MCVSHGFSLRAKGGVKLGRFQTGLRDAATWFQKAVSSFSKQAPVTQFISSPEALLRKTFCRDPEIFLST